VTSNSTNDRWRKPLVRSAASRAAGLSILGFIGWLWFLPADAPPWPAVTLVAVLTLAAALGLAWYLARARAEVRWWAAMERYVELELAKGLHPRSDSRARPQPRGR
jgi:hypothetical protein